MRRTYLKRSHIRISAAALGLTDKKPKRSFMAITMTPNDRRWSRLIHLRDRETCRKCGRQRRPGFMLYAAHLFGRGAKMTRCDEDNGFLLCRTDDDYFAKHTTEYKAWAREQLGAERYDRLLVRSNIPAIDQDDDVIKLYLDQRLAFYKSQQSS